MYLRAVVRRALLLWLLARVSVTGFGAATVGFALALSPPAVLLLALTVAALALVDARVMRESLFHANLGTPAWLPGVFAGVIVLALELIVAIAVAVAA